MLNIKYKPPVKRTVKEELEYWNVVYILRSLNKYFNSLHGYDRGLQNISAEDFSMTVIKKILTGERSWEKSTQPCFLDFCFSVMKSEINNFKSSTEYKNIKDNIVISYDFSLEKENRWTRLGLQDEFNGF